MRDLNFASLRSEIKFHSRTRLRAWLRANKTWAATLLLAAASLIFYFSQLGSLGSFLYRPGSQVSDLTITFWPNIAYIQQSLREFHQLPLWRTLIFSGSPFDVDPQSGLWYPPNLVFLFTPAAVGLNLLFILHTLAAGVGMWFWARSLGLSFWAALLSSLAFAFSPRAFAHLGTGHLGIVYAAAYVPWCLWAGYQLGKQRWRYAGLLGLALGWQAIAHLQIAVYTGLAVGLYALAVAFFGSQGRSPWKRKHRQRPPHTEGLSALGRVADATRDWKSFKLVFGGLALGALLSLAVAAVLLLPLLRFAPQSSRASMEIVDAGISSLPLRYLWGLVMPDYSGYMDYMLYAGVPLLVLALLGLSRPQARFWGFFVLAAILYALGASTPLFQIVFRVMPLLAYVRAPSRVWLVAMAPVALLAGMGMQCLMAGLGAATRRRLNLLLVALAATGLALGVGYFALFGVPPTNLAALAVLMPATGLVVGALAARKISWQVGGALVILLVMSDLILVDATLIESRAPGQVFAGSGLGDFLALRDDGQPFRVYSPSYSLPRHIAIQAGLESADGVDPIFLDSYDRFFELASGIQRQRYGVTVPAMEGPGPIELVNQDAQPDANLLGLLNVRYVAAEFPMQAHALQPIGRFGQTYLYENQAYLPRAFVVGSVTPVGDLDQALARIQTIDLSEQALVEGGPHLSNGALEAQVTWRQRSPNRLSLQVTLDKDGFLVLSQVFYPGWKLLLDGKLDRIWTADGVLSGVYLPAGEHDLIFTYHPPTLWPGLFVTGLGILICLVLIAGRKASNIAAGDPPDESRSSVRL
jgi:hypothetical protein